MREVGKIFEIPNPLENMEILILALKGEGWEVKEFGGPGYAHAVFRDGRYSGRISSSCIETVNNTQLGEFCANYEFRRVFSKK